MLATRLLPFTHNLDAGALDQQVERTRARALGDRDGQAFLPPAQSVVVKRGPVQVRQPQEARYQSGVWLDSRPNGAFSIRQARMPQREGLKASKPATRHRYPLHLGTKPEQQNATLQAAL